MDTAHDPAQSASATPPSRWARATEDDREALHDLAGSYWYCVYAWWRRSGLEAGEAAQATLASFTRWLTDAPPRAAHTRGSRMREWLPARLGELARQGVHLQGEASIVIDPAWAEQCFADEPAGDPDSIFQRRWALTLLDFSMQSLRTEYEEQGQAALFAEVTPFAGFGGGEDDRYTETANRLGRTIGGARKVVYDFRSRHRELLRAFVGDTVLDPADIDSEITALLCACDVPGTEAAAAPLPTSIRRFKPDELLARAMHTVHMTNTSGGQWTPPSDEEIARLFPQYEMRGMLGRGGMGAVYKGRQMALDRFVAIKLLPLEVSVDQEFADRFVREARAMARLNHPNILDVYDFGTTSEGHLYFVMEFVEGANLAEMIHADHRGTASTLSSDQALGITGQVCAALAYAHGKGIVHRDIKPANVMVDIEGTAKVADFGLARLTEPGGEPMGHTMTGTVMGTPDYMAPEQKRGMNVDHRADIYSVGVMLYEMLCKETPQGVFEPPSVRVGCDPSLDQIVIKAMTRDPEKRYQSTQEMKADVDAARTPIPAPPKSDAATVKAARPIAPLVSEAVMKSITPPPKAPPPKRSRLPLVGGIAAVVVIVGIVFAVTRSKPRSDITPHGLPPGATPATPGNWQPLVTDEVWRKRDPNNGFEDGLRHVTRGSLKKRQPSRDGTIRTRIHIRAGTRLPSITIRESEEEGYYKLEVGKDLSVILLSFIPAGENPPVSSFVRLGRHELAKPLQPGDKVDLELEALDDRLVARLNGATVLDQRDSRVKGEGRWGITADDGWFESVEMKRAPVSTSSPSSPTAEWQSLFNGRDFSGWKMLGGAEVAPDWRISDKAIIGGKRSCIATEQGFSDFELELEWRVTDSGNGGVYYHVPLAVKIDYPHGAPEMQLAGKNQSTLSVSGSLFRVVPASQDASRPSHEWNSAKLNVRGGTAEHWINGVLVCRYDFDDSGWAKTAAESKFGEASDFAAHKSGSIALQGWEQEVQYRNLRVRALPSPAPAGVSSLPPTAKPATPTVPTSAKSINLLALVDVKRDASKGRWSMKPEGLSLDWTDDFGVCELPYEPPDEYDFEAEFTPTSDGLNPTFYLRAGGAAFAWKLNAHALNPPAYGIDLLDGRKMPARTEAVATNEKRIETHLRYVTRMEVRRDGLRGFVDGAELFRWTGDFKRLSLEEGCKLRNERAIGIGAYKRSIVFHRVEVREITGTGKLTAALADKPAIPAMPSDVRTFGGHRYQLVRDPLTWDDARAYAESRKGHLATITTEEEAKWFDTTFGPGMTPTAAFWLGASSDGVGHPWKWVTGEPWSRTDWLPGEPKISPEPGARFALQLAKAGEQLGWSTALHNPAKKFSFIEWDNTDPP